MEVVPILIVLCTVLFVSWLDGLENKVVKSLFNWIPAILLVYVIPSLTSYAIGADFSNNEVHNYSKDYFIPLAIITVMSSLSLKQLRSIGIKPIVLFVSGSTFIALFPVLFFLVFRDSSLVTDTMVELEYWKGVPPIVGSWIGGSTSQLVLKELVNCPEAIFLSILVMDGVLVNLWTILMFQGIKRSPQLNGLLRISDVAMPSAIRKVSTAALHPWLTFLIFLVLVFVVNQFISAFVVKVVLLSLAGLLLGNAWPRWNYAFSLKAGSVLILVVMAILGLRLRFETLGVDLSFLGFLVIWLVGHYLFMVLVAKWMNLNMAWVPIASMANVGGIATAPAVTAAYNKSWMPHAIILAVLSMATGTFWGMLTIYLLQTQL